MRALILVAGLAAASLSIAACSDDSDTDPSFSDGPPVLVDSNGSVVVEESDVVTCPDDSVDVRCSAARDAEDERPATVHPS